MLSLCTAMKNPPLLCFAFLPLLASAQDKRRPTPEQIKWAEGVPAKSKSVDNDSLE